MRDGAVSPDDGPLIFDVGIEGDVFVLKQPWFISDPSELKKLVGRTVFS